MRIKWRVNFKIATVLISVYYLFLRWQYAAVFALAAPEEQTIYDVLLLFAAYGALGALELLLLARKMPDRARMWIVTLLDWLTQTQHLALIALCVLGIDRLQHAQARWELPLYRAALGISAMPAVYLLWDFVKRQWSLRGLPEHQKQMRELQRANCMCELPEREYKIQYHTLLRQSRTARRQ